MVKKKKITTTTTVVEEVIEDGPKKGLDVSILLDASGSMKPTRDKTISAINEYLNTLKGQDDCRVTVVAFDSGHDNTMRYRILRDKKPVDGVEPITHSEYSPDGGTPLNDAAARMIRNIDDDGLPGRNKAMVILSDGEENASREFSIHSGGSGKIKVMLEQRQKSNNWLVIYLGANQDAFAESAARGIYLGTSANFSMNNMGATLRAAGAATKRYAAKGDVAMASFTASERTSMMDADEADGHGKKRSIP